MKVETVTSLYKNKGDIQNYNNYRDIKLLSHTMKVCERAVKIKVKKGVSMRINFDSCHGDQPQMPFIL